MAAVSPPSRPTSADVARHAGVSRATVSYVLNGRTDHTISEATRQRVWATVRELGYAPNASARTLRAGRSNIVLMPLPEYPFSPAVDAMIENLDRELAARGLCLLLHGDRTAAGVEGATAWAELRPAAVYLDAHRCTRAAVTLLRRAGVEVVLLHGPTTSSYAPVVPMDQTAVARLATQHLLDRGHRRLACLVPGGQLSTLATQRWRAVAATAHERAATTERVDCDLTIDSLTPAVTRWTEPSHRPEAIYAYNDEFALMLVQALGQSGIRVPEDVAVVGSGNLPLGAMLHPRLTTVHFDTAAIGRAVASSIRQLLDGQDVDPQLAAAVQPHLVIRDSG